MAEELDQSTEGTGASSEEPASNGGPVDLDSLMAALDERLNKRFSGIQSLIDTKVSPLAEQLAELKTAGMSPEEREQLEEQAEQQRIAALERENQFLKARQSNPDAVDFLMALDKADSFDDQLKLIAERFGAKAADQVEAAVEATEGEEATPAVDSNNPARSSSAGISAALATGQVSNEAEADELLRLAGNTPLAALRRPKE